MLWTCFEFQQPQNLCIQTFARKLSWNRVNCVDVFHRNYTRFGDVTEQRDLAFQFGRNVPITSAKQNVRLNSYAQHFFYAVLCRLGFLLARGGNVRHQRHMHEERIFCTEFQAHLPDGFQKRQRLDVANGSANLYNYYVHVRRDFLDDCFNLVRDMRNHLHGFPQVITAPFLGENGFVDSACRPIVIARQLRVREPFIVPEVQVGLGAVFRHEHFAVLKRTHRAGIDVQIGIAFLNVDFEAATFEETTDGGSCYALAK